MKKKTSHPFIVFALITCLIPMLAYARKYPLTATPVVPGAKGYVDVGQDKNGNTEVELKAEFLPKPSSLTPPAENYIVWFRQQGSEPKSQGQLKVDDNLRGEFKTTTNMKNFDPSPKLPPDRKSCTQQSRNNNPTRLRSTFFC